MKEQAWHSGIPDVDGDVDGDDIPDVDGNDIPLALNSMRVVFHLVVPN